LDGFCVTIMEDLWNTFGIYHKYTLSTKQVKRQLVNSSIKIIVLSTPLLHSLLEDILKTLLPEGVYRVVDYVDFMSIANVYASLENEADGFLLAGGRVAKAAIQKGLQTPRKPMASFMLNSTSFYKLMLNLLHNNRQLDLHRVALDGFLPLREHPSLADSLDDKKATRLDEDVQNWVNQLSLEDIYSLDEDLARKITTLWKAKKIDLVVCTYSGIMERLQEQGIPCAFAYPDTETVKVALDRLLADIQIAAMRENLPVIISVSKKRGNDTGDQDSDPVSLHKGLLDFNRENITDFLIQKTADGFDIFTSLRIANQITNNFQTCQISHYLTEHLDFEVSVGYGIGNDIAQAKANASSARKESALSGSSYVMDEKNNLIGPLDSDQYLAIKSEFTPEIYRTADQARLSTLTIQKIVSIMNLMGTNRLTTQDLTTKLGVSVRNAQRILSALEKSGLAVVQNYKTSSSMGRPVKVYEINFAYSKNR